MISIIGTGKVGSTTAFLLTLNGLDDIMLIDIVKGLPQGIALDLSHVTGILGVNVRVSGSNDLRDIAGSDIVIVTAGFPRKAGMTREDLLNKNSRIIVEISEKIREYAPKSIVTLTTNPVDVLTYLMYKTLGFPRNRVIGFGGILDSGRYRFYLSQALGISPSSINAYVIGHHGDYMVPLHRFSNIAGKSIQEILDKEKLTDVSEKTINAGAEIIRLCGFSSTYAPAIGLYQVVEAILRDKKELLIASIVLDGEYGVSGVALNVPVIIGREGVMKIFELPLNEDEMRRFKKCADIVRKGIEKATKFISCA